MNSPSYLEEPQVAFLSRIISDVRTGSILIPRFQRKFVWSDEDRLKLLDSIKDGIPIGSFLVWRTSKHKLDTFPKIGGVSVPVGPVETPGAPRQYLLDGHQRLSTLFGALSPTEAGIDDSPDFIAGDILYDLREECFILASKRKSYPVVCLPLYKMLDSIELLKFQRNLIVELDHDILISRADALANRFRNYKIPIIPIVTDDLEAATRAFERINSTGVRMDDYHMVAALTYSEGFSLADKLDEAKERLGRISWQDLDEKYILAIIRAKVGLEISSPNALATSQYIKANPDAVSEVVDALIKAAAFLRKECLVPSPYFMPYSYQIVFLSYAFLGEPVLGSNRIELLRRWFWKTTYLGFFRGARESDLSAARAQINEIINLGEESYWQIYRPDVIVRPERGRFDARSARAKAIFNRLVYFHVENRPEDSEMVLNTMADQGPRCLVQMIQSYTYSGPEIRGFENRFLVPSIDGWKLRDQIDEAFLWGNDNTLMSHAVTPEAAEYLSMKDYEAFFSVRRQTILNSESQFVRSVGLHYFQQDES